MVEPAGGLPAADGLARGVPADSSADRECEFFTPPFRERRSTCARQRGAASHRGGRVEPQARNHGIGHDAAP